MPSDGDLFDAYCGGDRRAGATLFDRHYAAVARFFHNKVDPSASADLAQSVFLACTSSRDRFRRDASFRTYLFAIAHNLLRKHYERSRRAPPGQDIDELRIADLAPSPSSNARAKEEHRMLLAGLRALPLACQVVLELHYWEELSVTEIAQVVAVPEGTVKSRLQRGRRLLEERLQELASSKELLSSTLDDLERWAQDLRPLVDASE